MKRAFTTIELVVSVTIVAVLVALLFSAIQKVRISSSTLKCANNQRQIALAVHMYHDTKNTFPPALRSTNLGEQLYHLSWLGRLAPFILNEQSWQRILNDYNEQPRPFSPKQHFMVDYVVNTYGCPSDPYTGITFKISGSNELTRNVSMTSYLGNLGTNFLLRDGVIFKNSNLNYSHITDGSTNTLLMGERPPSQDGRYGWWYAAAGQMASGSLDYVLGANEVNRVNPLYYTYQECKESNYTFRRQSLRVCPKS